MDSGETYQITLAHSLIPRYIPRFGASTYLWGGQFWVPILGLV